MMRRASDPQLAATAVAVFLAGTGIGGAHAAGGSMRR